MPELFERYRGNPIITVADLPYRANVVFNPGVTEVDGEVVLLLRVEDRRGMSHLTVARSADGVTNWRISDTPLLGPTGPEWPYEQWGCEDPRITQIDDHEWVIAYTGYSRFGPAVAMAGTHDFHTAARFGIVFPPNNKDATVFPERVDDMWFILHRPASGSQEHIWYACSPDLINWSRPGCLMEERGGPWWDGLRIGVGSVPIPTDQGWLLIYHGVKELGGQPIYRLGLALLERDNPRHVLNRSSEYVFSPREPYERAGDLANVVYTCGTLLRGDEVWMYYGAADTCVGLATAHLPDLVQASHDLDGE
jgi:beta-1,4-mannooligosaccharide/beta-1,4-mannosyl-N-acetylglucosamine phosphorylase